MDELREDVLREEKKKGEQAKLLMEQLAPYFDSLEDNIISEWKSAGSTDKREQLHTQLKVLNQLKFDIKVAIQNGGYATRILNERY